MTPLRRSGRTPGKTEPRTAPGDDDSTVSSNSSSLPSPSITSPCSSGVGRGVWFVLLVTFFDMVSVGLVVPLITTRTRSFGASPVVVGAVQSVFGALQLLSSPVAGHLSDIFGRRRVLACCMVGAGAAYALTGTAGTLAVFILARVMAGTFKQTLNITKAYMADMTPPDQRTASLSWLYAAKSMGFIVGPLCGGLLYKTYPVAPFLISGTVYLLIASGVFFFAPGGRGDVGGVAASGLSSSSSPANAVDQHKQSPPQRSLIQVLKTLNPTLRYLLLIRLLTGLGVTLIRSSFVLVMEYQFDTLTVSDKGILVRREQQWRWTNGEKGVVVVVVVVLLCVALRWKWGRLRW